MYTKRTKEDEARKNSRIMGSIQTTKRKLGTIKKKKEQRMLES